MMINIGTNVNHHTLIWAYYIYSDQSDYRAARACPVSDGIALACMVQAYVPRQARRQDVYAPLYPTGKGSVEMDHNTDFN